MYAYCLLIVFPMKAQHFVNCRYLFWVTLELTNQNYFSQFFILSLHRKLLGPFKQKNMFAFVPAAIGSFTAILIERKSRYDILHYGKLLLPVSS